VGHPYDVEHATRLHVEWCVALIERTGLITTNQTEPQMRAVMHELRRSLSLDYAPDPSADPDQFYERVYERVKGHHTPPRSIAADVFWLWSRKLPARQAEAIRENLPAVLEPLWPAKTESGRT